MNQNKCVRCRPLQSAFAVAVAEVTAVSAVRKTAVEEKWDGPIETDDTLSVAGVGEKAVAVSSGFKNKSAVANDIFVAYTAYVFTEHNISLRFACFSSWFSTVAAAGRYRFSRRYFIVFLSDDNNNSSSCPMAVPALACLRVCPCDVFLRLSGSLLQPR